MAAKLPEYAPTSELLLTRMQALYDVMSVIDLTHDILIQIKSPAEDAATFGEQHTARSSTLSTIVRASVCDEDQPLVLTFLQPDAIRAAL